MRRPYPDSPAVLFVTDNGHGLGHVTRMMAVARRGKGRFTPVFLTLSAAFPLLREFGFPAEYLPAPERLQMPPKPWHSLFASRVANLLELVRARVVVVDHVVPPRVLARLRGACSGIEFIWSRRGLWREGRNEVSLPMFDAFDTIAEPGDLAAPLDRGFTSELRQNVTALSPVVLVSEGEQEKRDEARQALDLPASGRAILIQLSDSDSSTLSTLITEARDAVRKVSDGDEIHMFAPLHPLHRGRIQPVDGVVMRPIYPVARYLRAFDGVISTAGYNSFHEVVVSGLPAVFLARDSESLDDQERRVAFAELSGRAFSARSAHDAEFAEAVKRMLAPEEHLVARAVTEQLGSFSGADELADLIAARCDARSDERFHVGWASPIDTPNAGEPSERVVMSGLGLDEDALFQVVDQLADAQKESLDLEPILLVESTVDPEPLSQRGLPFETIMTPGECEAVGNISYEDYVQRRLAELQTHWQANKLITLTPGLSADDWLLA